MLKISYGTLLLAVTKRQFGLDGLLLMGSENFEVGRGGAKGSV